MKKITAFKTAITLQPREDAWSAQKAKLEELSQEQTQADIALVEANRAYQSATAALQKATERKTTAEKKLSHARGQLGSV